MFSDKVRKAFQTELSNGERARLAGFEGRARVCARRAAGEAAREYLRLAGTQQNGSAVVLLGMLVEMEGVTPRAREAAAHLLTRVDEGFNLAEGVDLLEEARTLAIELERLEEL